MKRRKPNRLRRIVKKLLKRAIPASWNCDAYVADGKRYVTGQELMEHGIRRAAK